MKRAAPKIKKVHPFQWVFEPLLEDSSFYQKKMFGCEAAYLRGQLCLALTVGEEPWNGMLICTSREFHDSLMSEFKALVPHKVLGKWLYLSQNNPDFEDVANRIARLIRRGDSRIGVESKPKKRKTSAGRKGS